MKNDCSFVFTLLPTLFQLSWFEVLSGAAVLAVTMNSLSYHVQTSAHPLTVQFTHHKDPLIKKMNWLVTQYFNLQK